jgi:hypothetical protein
VPLAINHTFKEPLHMRAPFMGNSVQSLRNSESIREKMKEIQASLQKLKASLRSIRERIQRKTQNPAQ